MNNSLRYTLLAAIILISIALFVIFVYPRYYIVGPGRNGSDIAELLVERNKPADDCLKMVHFDIGMRPTLGQDKALCIYQYAKLAKDPTACEALLPDGYGWSCLGAAREGLACTFLSDAQQTVKGNKMVTTLDQCVNGPPEIRNNECCIAARISLLDSDESCETITERTDIKNRCYYDLAINRKDIELCEKIEHENAKAACEVGVNALLKE